MVFDVFKRIDTKAHNLAISVYNTPHLFIYLHQKLPLKNVTVLPTYLLTYSLLTFRSGNAFSNPTTANIIRLHLLDRLCTAFFTNVHMSVYMAGYLPIVLARQLRQGQELRAKANVAAAGNTSTSVGGLYSISLFIISSASFRPT